MTAVGTLTPNACLFVLRTYPVCSQPTSSRHTIKDTTAVTAPSTALLHLALPGSSGVQPLVKAKYAPPLIHDIISQLSSLLIAPHFNTRHSFQIGDLCPLEIYLFGILCGFVFIIPRLFPFTLPGLDPCVCSVLRSCWTCASRTNVGQYASNTTGLTQIFRIMQSRSKARAKTGRPNPTDQRSWYRCIWHRVQGSRLAE